MLYIDEAQSDPTNCVIRSALPDGIEVRENKYGKCLIATKRFEKNSNVYVGSCLYIPETITSYTICVGEVRHQVTCVNSVLGGPKGHRQLYGIDGFMNHSCEVS